MSTAGHREKFPYQLKIRLTRLWTAHLAVIIVGDLGCFYVVLIYMLQILPEGLIVCEIFVCLRIILNIIHDHVRHDGLQAHA